MASAAASSLSVYTKLFNKHSCGSAIPGFSSIRTTSCYAGTVHWRSTLHLKGTQCLPISNTRSIFKCVHRTSEPSVSIDSLQSNDISARKLFLFPGAVALGFLVSILDIFLQCISTFNCVSPVFDCTLVAPACHWFTLIIYNSIISRASTTCIHVDS